MVTGNEFVRAIIERDGRFLVMKEQWSNGIRWVFPGGKIDEYDVKHRRYGFEVNPYHHALDREVEEETGMRVERIFFAYEHQLTVEGVEWTGFYYHVEASGEPQILEPHKCLGMQWATPDELERLDHIKGTLNV